MPVDPHFSQLLAFIPMCLLVELTPGPNMAYLTIVASTSGRKAGYWAVAGIAAGLITIGFAVSFGLGELIERSPIIYQLLRWSGVLYLMWLAVDGWRSVEIFDTAATVYSSRKHFFSGFLTNVLNPKAGVFYMAVLPQFVTGSSKIAGQLVALTLVYVLIATVIHLNIIIMASYARRFFSERQVQQKVTRALSVLLFILALWLAWVTGAR
jgi:threonine/homoserine/homoserine lactone efflux protein